MYFDDELMACCELDIHVFLIYRVCCIASPRAVQGGEEEEEGEETTKKKEQHEEKRKEEKQKERKRTSERARESPRKRREGGRAGGAGVRRGGRLRFMTGGEIYTGGQAVFGKACVARFLFL